MRIGNITFGPAPSIVVEKALVRATKIVIEADAECRELRQKIRQQEITIADLEFRIRHPEGDTSNDHEIQPG